MAFLARRLDVGAQLLARLGDDELKEQALQPLREIGVDLSRTSTVQGYSTGVAMIAIRPDGQKTIILAGNANEAQTRDDASEVAVAIERAPGGSVLVVDYEIPGFVVEEAVEAAARRGLPVILDPAPPDRVEQSILPRIDVIVPDASEAEHLTGIAIDDAGAAARAAPARRIRRLPSWRRIVRRPGAGALLLIRRCRRAGPARAAGAGRSARCRRGGNSRPHRGCRSGRAA